MNTKNQPSENDSQSRKLLIDIPVVILIIITVPFYLILTLLINIILVIQYVIFLIEDFLHTVWFQISGTATLQSRLKGDILAAKGDALRFLLEIFEIHKKSVENREQEEMEVSINDIRQLEELIGFTEPSKAKWFRFYLPGFNSFKAALYGRDLSELFSGRIISPLSTDTSANLSETKLSSFPPDTLWALITMNLLKEAEQNLRRNTETAFRAYLRAERYLVFAEYVLYVKEKQDKKYKKIPNPLFSRAMLVNSTLPIEMREEERNLVADLLLKKDDKGNRLREVREDLSIIEIDRAIEVLDQYRLKDYREIENLRVNLLIFLGVSTLLIAVTLVYFPEFLADWVPDFGYVTTEHTLGEGIVPQFKEGYTFMIRPIQQLFGLILLFGAIGAGISGIRTIQTDSGSIETLQNILGYWLALARMIVGAISAFVVALFLFSGVIDDQYLTLPIVLGTAIAAGFSERLLIRAITSFSDRTAPEPISSDTIEREIGTQR